MKAFHGALASVIVMIVCCPAAHAFSALGLRNALDNCLNKNVPPQERVEACNEVIHTNVLLPRDRARVITSRGNARFASANLNDALDDYNKAVALNPQFAPALVNRGVVLVRLGKCDRALSDFNTALSLDAHSWQALYGRSICEAKAGDLTKAQSDLAAASAIEPKAVQDFAPVEIPRWYQ